MASVFAPGHYEQLHRILTDAISSPARVAHSNEWYIALDRSRNDLADLVRVRPTSEVERREIQSGKVTIEGVTHDLNADFAQQTIALSQHLDVSERYAASLLQAGMQARAKWGRGAVEVACILFHRERLAAIACLKELIGGAATLSRDEEDADARRLGAKMQQLVDALLVGPQPASFVKRILREIDSVKTKMLNVIKNIRGIGNQAQVSGAVGQQLSDDLQMQRLQMMRKERQDLGHILYLLSCSRLLGSESVVAIAEWLANVNSADKNDAMLVYQVIVLLNAIEVVPEEEEVTSSHQIMDDPGFVKRMHTLLTTKEWQISEVRNVVLLQWCLFLAEATKRSPSLANELRVHQETLQKLFIDAVHGDAFYFIVLHILSFRQRQVDALEGEETDTTEANAGSARLGNGDWNGSIDGSDDNDIDVDFQEYLLTQVQDLILSLTSLMLPFLRKLQRSEEDAAFAANRSGAGDSVGGRRFDIEALFDSVALLCRARPDAGLAFWLGGEGKGTRFLNWAIEVRESGHQRALFEMLASISAGKESAWHAHSLLSFGDGSSGSVAQHASSSFAPATQQARSVSWTRLFDWIQQYNESYHSPATAAHPVTSGSSTPVMTPNEAIILRGFLRLLRNVAHYSVAAREGLYQHSSYELVPRLFAFYACPIIVEVKASVLDALSAFAHPSGSNSAKITAQLWTILESTIGVTLNHASMRASTPASSSSATSIPTLTKAVHDLQSVEVPARIFPVTTSLVNFLKSLIHTPSRLDQQSIDALTGEASDVPFQGLALNLGQGQRVPGLEPYVHFVIDTVLLQASMREYSDASERWRVTSACLDFIERCLMSYDVNILLANGGEAANASVLTALALHPGFSIMKRMLTGTRLLQEILNVINPNAGVAGAAAGFEIINTNRANTLFFVSSVRHCMRIVQRVLQLQDVFLQVLLPTLSDAGPQLAAVDISGRVGHPSLYSSLDSLLLHAHQSVVQIALYINCTRNDVALLAIRIVGLLASSAAFSDVDRFGGMGYYRKMNRFVGLLEMSDEADRIRAGCMDRLESEADEPSSDLDSHVRATLALMRIAGNSDEEDEDDELQQIVVPSADADEAIRMAILDLLIANTGYQVDAPNIAHLLLGFDLRAVKPEEQIIPDADAIDTPPSALHAILALLRPEQLVSTMAIAQRSPAFAEKCHTLIGNLCRHPYTSAATLRYLRTKEDFFVQQLRALPLAPVKRTSAEFGAIGVLIQRDGGHISTTVDALISSIEIRSHVLALVALELHTLCNAELWGPARRLVAVLLGRESVIDSTKKPDGLDFDDDEAEDVDDVQHYEQRGRRLLDILASFDFEWHDAREDKGEEPTILRTLDLSQAQSSQVTREFDIRATLRLLAAARRELDRRGDLAEGRKRAEFDRDATLILEHVACRNARRVVALARRAAMQSWRNTLDMTFSRANHLLNASNRSTVILDCLTALLPRLSGATSESDPSLSDLAAGAVLGLLTRLRYHQAAAVAEDELGVISLPVDRLISTLQSLIEAIIEPGTTMQARGNLYSALINYLQLISKSGSEKTDDDLLAEDDGASTLGGTQSDIFDESSSAFAGFSALSNADASRKKRSSALENRCKSVLAAQAERLVPVIARDALDAADVWRTVAFTLFDRLAALQSKTSSSRTLLLDILSKKGFLKSFVANLREMDVALQEVLRPDPSSLNALYVYEAQIAFFSRLAQSRKGAERLVDARLFDVLSQVDFLQARPHQYHSYAQEDDYADLESFLPAVTSRYEAMLVPAVQLAVSVLFNSVRSTTSSAGSVLSAFTGTRTVQNAGNAQSVPRQALSFLHAHGSALLVPLKNATQDAVSLSVLEQAQLVISLLVFVLPVLDDDALSPSKPLAQFHHAALALSAIFLYEPHWRSRVVPHSETEKDEAAEAASGQHPTGHGDVGLTSMFDARAKSVVQRLEASLLAYLERASEYAGVDEGGRRRVRPCLTNSLYTHPAARAGSSDVAELSSSASGPGRYGLHANRNANVASLGTALASLDECVRRSSELVLALDKMQGMLDSSDAVRLEEWDDIIASDSLESEEIASLSPVRRKAFAIRILHGQRTAKRAELRHLLNSIEMLLVLLYRHFLYYIELGTSAVSRTPFGAPATHSSTLRQGIYERGSSNGPVGASSAAETAALIRDGGKITAKVLEHLDGMVPSIDESHGVVNAEERKAYIAMIARRLQGVLLDNAEEGQ